MQFLYWHFDTKFFLSQSSGSLFSVGLLREIQFMIEKINSNMFIKTKADIKTKTLHRLLDNETAKLHLKFGTTVDWTGNFFFFYQLSNVNVTLIFTLSQKNLIFCKCYTGLTSLVNYAIFVMYNFVSYCNSVPTHAGARIHNCTFLYIWRKRNE